MPEKKGDVVKTEFRVPYDLMRVGRHIVSAIIGKIPDEWAVLTGALCAPDSMLRTGEALASTNLLFANSIGQMIKRAQDEDVADIYGVLIQGKKPARIDFGGLFGYCEVMPMEQSKKMCIHFVELGYLGRLKFAWRNSEEGDPFGYGCEIHMDDAPRITIKQDRENLNQTETVEPLLEVCRGIELTERPV